jgi:hypothetical protein
VASQLTAPSEAKLRSTRELHCYAQQTQLGQKKKKKKKELLLSLLPDDLEEDCPQCSSQQQ